MTEFQLRPAQEQDASIIFQLILEGKINPTGLDWRRFIVAEDERGQVIGCGQIKLHRDGSQELASIAVTTDWRGRGVARLLIEGLVREHEGDLYLMCTSRIGSLYEKFNFHEIEENEMPRYFRRVSKLAGIIEPLRKKGHRLLIMKWEKTSS